MGLRNSVVCRNRRHPTTRGKGRIRKYLSPSTPANWIYHHKEARGTMISSLDTGSQKPVNGQAARADYSSEQVAKARDAIAVWQSKLLDVSKGNRLLRFRTTKLTTVSVVAPSLPTLLAWLIGNNGSYALAPRPSQERLLGVHSNEAPAPSSPPNTLLCDAGTDKLWAALYNLRQKSQAAIEERGVNILFLALGFLCWDDPQEKDVRWRAPLILVPVTLERVGADNYRIHSLDEETILNPTLDHKLSHDHLLTLPELPDDLESLRPARVFRQSEDIGRYVAGRRYRRRSLSGALPVSQDCDVPRSGESDGRAVDPFPDGKAGGTTRCGLGIRVQYPTGRPS